MEQRPRTGWGGGGGLERGEANLSARCRAQPNDLHTLQGVHVR